MRIFWLFLYLLLFITCPISSYSFQEISNTQIENLFRNTTDEERAILENFIKNLITQHHFGYVLFGNKPMATCGIADHIDLLYLFSDDALKNQRLRKGWHIWQAQRQFLNSDHFILRITKNPLCSSMSMLVLMNKKLVLDCIEKNISLFHKGLGEKAIPEKILADLETKDSILQDVLMNHEELLGILLGYGTHNSLMYVQTKPFNSHFFVPKEGVVPLTPSKSLYTHLIPFNDHYHNHLLFIDLPQFGMDKQDPESIDLKQSYNTSWYELNKIFYEKKFLRTFLAKWFMD